MFPKHATNHVLFRELNWFSKNAGGPRFISGMIILTKIIIRACMPRQCCPEKRGQRWPGVRHIRLEHLPLPTLRRQRVHVLGRAIGPEVPCLARQEFHGPVSELLVDPAAHVTASGKADHRTWRGGPAGAPPTGPMFTLWLPQRIERSERTGPSGES